MIEWVIFLHGASRVEHREKACSGPGRYRKNKQVIKLSASVCWTIIWILFWWLIPRVSHCRKLECWTIGNTIESTTSVEPITTTSAEKLCNFLLKKRRASEKREMFEQKQKAIICVLVGEQQFCKFFLLRETRKSLLLLAFYLSAGCLSFLYFLCTRKLQAIQAPSIVFWSQQLFSRFKTMPSMLYDYGLDYDVMEQEALKLLAQCQSVKFQGFNLWFPSLKKSSEKR